MMSVIRHELTQKHVLASRSAICHLKPRLVFAQHFQMYPAPHPTLGQLETSGLLPRRKDVRSVVFTVFSLAFLQFLLLGPGALTHSPAVEVEARGAARGRQLPPRPAAPVTSARWAGPATSRPSRARRTLRPRERAARGPRRRGDGLRFGNVERPRFCSGGTSFRPTPHPVS